MKFHYYFVAIVAILQISGVKSTNEEVRCDTFYADFTYEEIYEILWELFGVENYTIIVDYIESYKNTADFYSGALCHSCDTNVTDFGDCDDIIGVIGICTEDRSDPANCAAVALYNGVECNSASWCSLWDEPVGGLSDSTQPNGSFSADCSGISSNFPSCTVTCEGNVTTAEACMGDIAPTSSAPLATLDPTSSAPLETLDPTSSAPLETLDPTSSAPLETLAPTSSAPLETTTSSAPMGTPSAIVASVAGAAWLASFGA
jgi:hypothetical protein